jgi:hypothetical protein
MLFISIGQLLLAQQGVRPVGGIIDRATNEEQISWCSQECYYKLVTGDSIVRVVNDSIVAVYLKAGRKWNSRHANGCIAEAGKFRRYKLSVFRTGQYVKDYHVKVGKWRIYDINGRLVTEERAP